MPAADLEEAGGAGLGGAWTEAATVGADCRERPESGVPDRGGGPVCGSGERATFVSALVVEPDEACARADAGVACARKAGSDAASEAAASSERGRPEAATGTSGESGLRVSGRLGSNLAGRSAEAAAGRSVEAAAGRSAEASASTEAAAACSAVAGGVSRAGARPRLGSSPRSGIRATRVSPATAEGPPWRCADCPAGALPAAATSP